MVVKVELCILQDRNYSEADILLLVPHDPLLFIGAAPEVPFKLDEVDVVKKKLYVGNLPLDTTESDLKELFQQTGAAETVRIITDRDTGRSKGFGFVEMQQGADKAIAEMNRKDFKGRLLTVNEPAPCLAATPEATASNDTDLSLFWFCEHKPVFELHGEVGRTIQSPTATSSGGVHAISYNVKILFWRRHRRHKRQTVFP